ncbi:hypothetical protein L7F22_023611 [Adiantum nelumboides]|nr:hypothetical protein [Adiantum nelumboides]
MNGGTHASLMTQCMVLYGAWEIGNKACARRIPHEKVGHIEKLEDVGMEVHLEGEKVIINLSTIADSSNQPLKYMFEKLLGLVGTYKELIKESNNGIKRTLIDIKYVKAKRDLGDVENEGFLTKDDAFGNTLKRARPIFEKSGGKKRHATNTEPFTRPKKQHRASMQAKLDKKAFTRIYKSSM